MKNLKKLFLLLFLVFSFNQASWGNNPFELDQDNPGVLKITCELEESDIQNLQELNFKDTVITRLDFSNSGMKDKQVIIFLEKFLPKFPDLDQVVLKNYNISIKETTNFAEVLKKNDVEKMMDLIGDRIKNESENKNDDLIRLAKVLSKHSVLSEINFLDLSRNDIINRSDRKEITLQFYHGVNFSFNDPTEIDDLNLSQD